MADDGGGEAGAPAAGGSGGGGNGNAPPPQNKPFSLSFSKVARPAIAVGGKPKEEGATRELIKGVEGEWGVVAASLGSRATARVGAASLINLHHHHSPHN